ncbi:MAG: TIGR00730 family Rossman fold protein [Sulfurospirillaceae bacterium]|jgi:uncharacterized protein (TIGR00730 family)|nr:TIGR00730 family Rossman fold protein [Sulfurospirillaceae bacterium]MCK9546221.1 TIGR00730 family Rossman fold protein [Sulfurospirillaceae bacterium]MDY0237819.1 TIGR00730 family Rossman fold protein [Campylobacterales bacterium]
MNIAVFCGSSSGFDRKYIDVAKEFGKLIASKGHRLIYGGGRVGLMGTIANSVLENGGEVIGVIPISLSEKELAHNGVTKLHITKSMHERKALMASYADAFVAMPGGAGTLEEIFEVWTWGQLGYHEKPVAFLEVNGFYSNLFSFTEHMAKEGFIKQAHKDMLIIEKEPLALLERIYAYTPPVKKWE